MKACYGLVTVSVSGLECWTVANTYLYLKPLFAFSTVL